MIISYKIGGISINTTKYCYFVNKGEFFYENQILFWYDRHNNLLGEAQILKFIKHYHRKNKMPYVCVNIKFLNGTKNKTQTFNAEDSLGILFTSKIKSYKF